MEEDTAAKDTDATKTPTRIGSPPGTRRPFLVCCDESGIDAQPYYGFGSVWMPWDRRGDFAALVRRIRTRHEFTNEMKWTKVGRRNEAFYIDLFHEFFRRTWLMFHCVIIERSNVDLLKYHSGSRDLAMRKHFAMLLSHKIAFFAAGCPDKKYIIHVDPLPSRYKKADEAAEVIVNHQLKRKVGFAPIERVSTRDSKQSEGIQMSDVLLGATMSVWPSKKPATSKSKIAVRRELYRLAGWPELPTDSYPEEWKFNVWRFQDPREPRDVQTRPLNLVYPMPRVAKKRNRKKACATSGAQDLDEFVAPRQ